LGILKFVEVQKENCRGAGRRSPLLVPGYFLNFLKGKVSAVFKREVFFNTYQIF